MEANFAFRLAFLPTGKEGAKQVVGYFDKSNAEGLYESQPWYGAGFRFGGRQANLDVNGVASCGGYPANPDRPDISDGQCVTAACPFAPDADGYVAGQTFLSSLELTAEKFDNPALKPPKPPGLDNDGDDDEHECDDNDRSSISYGGGGQGGEGGEGGESGGNCRTSQAPAPLPILGAGAAFAWSRRVRRRYGLVVPATVAAGR